MEKKSFFFISLLLLLLNINYIYSIENDEEKTTYYIHFDLSDPGFKYKNESEKIDNLIITDSTSIRIPTTLLVK